MTEERREHFRVKYPSDCRPTLKLKGKEYGVIDISERGIRFEAGDTGPFKKGELVDITIKFIDGEVLELCGKIARLEPEPVALRLLNAIPLKKIRAEELYLIREYSKKKKESKDKKPEEPGGGTG